VTKEDKIKYLTHLCPFCGYTADRDYNASLNILRLGQSRQASTYGNSQSVACRTPSPLGVGVCQIKHMLSIDPNSIPNSDEKSQGYKNGIWVASEYIKVTEELLKETIMSDDDSLSCTKINEFPKA